MVQSPRAWFDRFAKVLKGQGYRQGQSDHTMFFNQSGNGKKTILIVYVDDIILTGDNTVEMERLKMILAFEFEVKDLGFLKYFLGMEVVLFRKGISISQHKYILDLLEKNSMLGCKLVDTPMESSNKLRRAEGDSITNKGRYQQLLGN